MPPGAQRPPPSPASPEIAALAHARTAEEVLEALEVTLEGLGPAQVQARMARYGPNALPTAKPPGILRIVARQFASPLIYILLAATVVSVALGDLADAGFIALVLALNATIGAIQESRAESSARALRSLVAPRAHVVRQGEEREIDATALVPGDVVVLESGMKVPADLRLLSGTLEIDESLLTGESLAVSKRPTQTVEPDTAVADRLDMAFAGTVVARGRGYGVVVATGPATELGRIAASLSEADTARPPLLHRMERFTKKIAMAVAVAVVVLGGSMSLRGAGFDEVFLTAVALAVSVIPEGLPVAMTVALAIAVRRMSRRNVIARQLAAVEALGSCTYIVSDKTGTLTMNELTVECVLLPGEQAWRVTGQGVVPEGTVVVPPDRRAAESKAGLLAELAKAVALCNDGTLVQEGEAWSGHGDTVDVALLVLAHKLGVTRAVAETHAPRVAAVPFEAERQFAATVNAVDGDLVVFVKGAGERVLAMCSRVATAEGEAPLVRAQVEAAVEALAAEGYRMLAVARGRGRIAEDGEVDPGCLRDLVLLGFVGMADPLRPEAPAAVDACRRAGIEVAMVTGDHPVTAHTVAVRLGLTTKNDPVVTGRQLAEAAAAGQEQFDALVASARVFARAEPQQKLQIVQSLLRAGHFAAVTGDGANDAPAMRAANIGVAMGKRGTDVAKETGELIIADDDFASIVAGVEEGRIAYANVRKVVFLLVSSGAAELVLFALAIASGLPLPLFPAQLLWLNLVTNGIQDVALAFEPGEGGELTQPPRPPRQPIFDGPMLRRITLSAAVMGGVSFAVFWSMLEQGYAEPVARNLLLLLLVLFENVQAGNARSERKSLLQLGPLRNPLLFWGVVVAQSLHVVAMYTPGLRDVLRVQPVSFDDWLFLLGIATSLFVVMELDKLVSATARRARARAEAGAS